MASRSSLLLLGTLGVLVLAGGAYLWQQLQRNAAAAASRRQLVDDVRAATEKQPPDQQELSALMARIGDEPDSGTDRELALARARIDHARGRHEKAFEEVADLAGGADATREELRLAAELQLARHALGVRASDGERYLRQAVSFAENAARDSGQVEDKLLAWTAAWRLAHASQGSDAQETLLRLTEEIVKEHDGTPAARFVAAVRDFRPEAPPAGLDELHAELGRPSAELEVLRASALLVAQPPRATEAIALMEPVVQRHPGLVEVRNVLATALHVAAAAEESLERRDRYIAQRDAHIDWLLKNASPGDQRQVTWTTMRAQRY